MPHKEATGGNPRIYQAFKLCYNPASDGSRVKILSRFK
jgi:hypothetical protein